MVIFYVLKINKDSNVYWKSRNFFNFPTLVSMPLKMAANLKVSKDSLVGRSLNLCRKVLGLLSKYTILILLLKKYFQSPQSHSIQECWGLKYQHFNFFLFSGSRIANAARLQSLTFQTVNERVYLYLKDIFQKKISSNW